MSVARRFPKPLFALVALAGLALAISACALFKPGSLSLSQPAGIGSVRIHFALCNALDEEEKNCEENNGESQKQSLLGIAVPKGASAPVTLTAVPVSGGPTIAYSRNDQVVQAISEASQETEEPWPPAGTEGVGYLSAPFAEEKGSREWTVDADFGLPVPTDGGPYGGPFLTSIWYGNRFANEDESENRPVDCELGGGSFENGEAACEFAEASSLGTSDLRIGPAATATAYVGGEATLQFGLDYGGTPSSQPTFNVTAASTVPQAGLTVSSPSFTPPGVAPDTHRSSASETVTVAVPPTLQPGVYDVTLTATAAGGGSVSQVGKLEVTTPILKLGKVKLNKAKGTATLSVGVPSAGTLTATGRKIAKVQQKPTGAATLKLTIRAKGKAKRLLGEKGKAKVRAKIAFTPSSGTPVTKSRAIVLKKRLAG